MDSFNESFGGFLTECRNNALEELNWARDYRELMTRQALLRSKLEGKLSEDGKAIFQEYMEVSNVMRGMEYNKVFLCGMVTPVKIGRRFDPSTQEYRDFIGEFQ